MQQAIKNALKVRGYIVLETSEHRQRDCCPKCGEWFVSHKGRGCTPGVPDLLVTHPKWLEFLPWFWIGIEVKGSDTPVSAAQAELKRLGAIIICRGEGGRDEALAAVARINHIFGLPNP